MKKLDVEQSKSALPKPVKEVILMIFDVEAMKSTMKEFEVCTAATITDISSMFSST